MSMNKDVHPSARPDSPHTRLRIAFFSMAAIYVGQSLHNMKDTESTILYAVLMPLGLFLAHLGIYRSPALQLLWGGVCLVGGLGAATVVVWRWAWAWATDAVPQRALPLWPFVGLPLMLGVGYLLVIDPDVRAYRRSLRTHRVPEWH